MARIAVTTITKAAATAIRTTMTPSPLRPRSRSVRASPRRIAGVHDGRNLAMELLEPAAERQPPRRIELVGGHEHPRAVDLEGLEGRRTEQPLHHPAVEQGERELLVAALHAEPAVEVVVLELDVVQTEVVAEPGEEVLEAELEPRARSRDRREGAREPVVAPGTVAA